MSSQINFYCPLCRSNDFEKLDSYYFNVYSELIAKLLSCDEKTLINDIYKSAKCNQCSTLFWLEPISKEIRTKLYTEILPEHPKGDDSTGKYFSIDGLLKKVSGLPLISSKRNRILDGYISSMKFIDQDEEKIISKLRSNLKIDDHCKLLLKEIFSRGAKPFSRHIGFRETELNSRIIELIGKYNAQEYHYIEYGCPDWGPINVLDQSEFNCLSIIPDSSIFWNCSMNNEHSNHLTEMICDNKDLIAKKNFNNSVLGLFLVADHLVNPIQFFKNYKEKGVSSIVILLEKIEPNKGLPIQHLTAWSHESFLFLAEELSMNIEFPYLSSTSYTSAILTK